MIGICFDVKCKLWNKSIQFYVWTKFGSWCLFGGEFKEKTYLAPSGWTNFSKYGYFSFGDLIWTAILLIYDKKIKKNSEISRQIMESSF